MDFLRSLAPHRASDAMVATAALPSRFETDLPLRRARVTSPAMRPEEVDPSGIAAGLRSATFAPAGEPTPAGLARARVGQSDAAITSSNHAPIVTERALSPDATVTRDAHDQTFAWPRTATVRSHPIARGSVPPRVVAGAYSPSGATPAVVPPRIVLAALAAAPTRVTPLSASLVAARATPDANRRPVVHVTIDRIEVRAPAATEAPKPAGRRRATSSSVTLSDYLGRDSSQRGGTS
jgi:hypothetical protein